MVGVFLGFGVLRALHYLLELIVFGRFVEDEAVGVIIVKCILAWVTWIPRAGGQGRTHHRRGRVGRQDEAFYARTIGVPS